MVTLGSTVILEAAAEEAREELILEPTGWERENREEVICEEEDEVEGPGLSPEWRGKGG